MMVNTVNPSLPWKARLEKRRDKAGSFFLATSTFSSEFLHLLQYALHREFSVRYPNAKKVQGKDGPRYSALIYKLVYSIIFTMILFPILCLAPAYNVGQPPTSWKSPSLPPPSILFINFDPPSHWYWLGWTDSLIIKTWIFFRLAIL